MFAMFLSLWIILGFFIPIQAIEVTSRGPVPCGQFYQERQVGGQCAIHAANAFMGERYVQASELMAFTKAFFLRRFGSANEMMDVIDVRNGTDPHVLFEFLVQKELKTHDVRLQGLEHKEFRFYKASSHERELGMRYVRSLEQSAKVDRMIIGRSGHFVAFRREAKTHQWVLIDSLLTDSEYPQRTYDIETRKRLTPSSYLEKYSCFDIIANGY